MKKEIVKYYNDLAKDYDENRFSNTYGNYVHQQESLIIEKYLSKIPIDHNLDLACGTGRFLEHSAYGVDISAQMIAVSKSKFPSKIILEADAENLPFENSFFKNVTSFHLFMHLDLDSLKNIQQEVSRVTKKGGYFIFDIPSEKRRKLVNYKNDSWHGGYQITQNSLLEIVSDNWEIVSFYGIAFFPIHRIPKKIRKFFIKIDTILCNSFLKEYSSHLIFILRKK